MKTFTIQQFSEISGLSVHTLRYYEKIALLDPVPRNASGYREYAEVHLRQVEFLKRLRDTGMPIQKMIMYAQLRKQGESTLAARRELLEKHEAQVKTHLAELENSLQMIQWKIEFYKNEEARCGEQGERDCSR
jgi:DNA-binding transcriptional MerR regulator